MIYIASSGDTWDSIAYKAFEDEFMFPQIMESNRKYYDIVIFEGGEQLVIPDKIVTENKLVASPFESGSVVRIITSPW